MSIPLEEIPLRGEMSLSDKRVPVLEEKGDHSVVDEVSPLPLSEQLKQIKYLYVEKSDMEKTFIITYLASFVKGGAEERGGGIPSPVGTGVPDCPQRQIKIKAPSKYNAKQKFYLEYPKYQVLRIEEKTK